MQTYQVKTRDTAVYPDVNLGTLRAINYCVLGIGGEAGEVIDKFKKVLRGDIALTPTTKQALRRELGDLLWYVARCADELGYDLDEVAAKNLRKLEARWEKGTIQGTGDNR